MTEKADLHALYMLTIPTSSHHRIHRLSLTHHKYHTKVKSIIPARLGNVIGREQGNPGWQTIGKIYWMQIATDSAITDMQGVCTRLGTKSCQPPSVSQWLVLIISYKQAFCDNRQQQPESWVPNHKRRKHVRKLRNKICSVWTAMRFWRLCRAWVLCASTEWSRGSCSAEQVKDDLDGRQSMKLACWIRSMRWIFSYLEAVCWVRHSPLQDSG